MRRLSSRTLGLLLGLALTCGAIAQSKLNSVQVSNAENGITISVSGENLPAPRQVTVMGGKVFIAEFYGTQLMGRGHAIRAKGAGVNGVNVVQFKARPPIARVVVRVAAGTPTPTVTGTGASCTITYGSVAQAPSKASASNNLPAITTAAVKPLVTDDQKTMSAVSAKSQMPLTVPPIESFTKPVTGAVIKSATPVSTSYAKSAPQPNKALARRVSLNFVGADIVFILKALSEQTGSNIVTSPEVKGMLTVSLRDVSVEEALDLTTKLAGYRYAKFNNTWVVGTSEWLTRMLVQNDADSGKSIMKVIPLASRKAGEIKRAIIKAMSLHQLNESIKIVHPLADVAETEGMGLSAQSGGTATAQANGAGAGATAPKEGDADYLILIGQQGKIDQAASMISQLDQALAQMNGVSAENSASFVPVSLTYKVRGGKAEDLAKAVATIAGGVSVSATPAASRASQSVIVSGRPAEVNRVMTVLEQLDSVEPNGELVYFVYDVKFADPRALRQQLMDTFETLNVAVGPQDASGMSFKDKGSSSSSAGSEAGAATPTTSSSGSSSSGSGSSSSGSGSASQSALNASPVFTSLENKAVPMRLVISGAKSVVDSALGMLTQVDRAAPQVAIEARVAELSKEDVVKAGFDWDIITGGALKFLRFNNSQDSPSNTGGLDITGDDFSASITASLDKILNKNNLIARPNVVAMDGREAVVFIGDVVRYIKNLQSTQNGSTVEIGEEEVGVKLNVMPRVGEGNLITLEVQPTVSFIKSFLETGGVSIPTTSLRTVRSTLRIRNGETIAIGGLISDEDRKAVSGLPLLMDLPVIGQLFRKSTTTKKRTEIVIFLTARVIDSPGAGGGNTKSSMSSPIKKN